jgi:hypothetical protein
LFALSFVDLSISPTMNLDPICPEPSKALWVVGTNYGTKIEAKEKGKEKGDSDLEYEENFLIKFEQQGP